MPNQFYMPYINNLMQAHLGWQLEVKPIDLVGSLAVHPTKKYDLRKRSDIKRIVVHTSNWDTTPERLAKYDITGEFIVNGKKVYNHISKTGCPAITYHECIMDDGTLYSTLPYEQISWHAGVWNPGSLAICMMYLATNPKTGKDEYAPSDLMMRSLQTRLGDICLELKLTPDKVVGHRELKGTGWLPGKGSRVYRKTCPGMQVDLDQLRKNVSTYMQIVLKCRRLYKGKIDGDFGPLSRDALMRSQ